MRPAAAAAAVLLASVTLAADGGWKQPPKEILEVLHAPDLPATWPDPSGDTIALATRLRYPGMEEIAAPMLRLAGVRVNPRTNSLHAETSYTDIALLDVDDGATVRVQLPPEARVLRFLWSHDGERFAFTNRASDGVELWVGDSGTGSARRVPGVSLNPMLGADAAWMPDGRRLLIKRIPADRGASPGKPARPEGPNVFESAGGRATSTYEARDVLQTAHDEALFEHHASAQVAIVDADSLEVTGVGAPGLVARAEASPDGTLLLVESIRRPFSRRHAWWRFPRAVEIRDLGGRTVKLLASLPMADAVPIHGVPEGPRQHAWRPTAPATLTWAEALDGGDWSRKVPHRDRLMQQSAPFDAEPEEIHRAVHRLADASWGDTDDLLLVEEYERERRWRHVWALHPDRGTPPVKVVDVSENERYADPGSPVLRELPNGHLAVRQVRGGFYFSGQGATPSGDRPFLDRFDVRTGRATRLWRSDPSSLERFIDFRGDDERAILIRSESPTATPNVFELRQGASRRADAGEATVTWKRREVTSFQDPAPVLRGITKRIVTFEREDGVPQSFTLYLPPGHREGTRLPTVLYAYPLEFSDPGTAGQVSGSEQAFTRLWGSSHLFLLLSGYAVLHDVTMPVIGDPDTAYDTFVQQLVSSAQAAIDRAVEMGVTDRDRVAVMGHSHGGLMTATLLAHTKGVFRAGIARSGAYNHTMRPFGFQSERRTLWEARDTYVHLSPVMHAPGIDEPLLIIHGEMDQNPGTVPLQSEKLYEAIRGTGGTARLVMLPHEMHGYVSREAVEHVLAEQLEWLDRHVKNATSAPATAPTDSARR